MNGFIFPSRISSTSRADTLAVSTSTQHLELQKTTRKSTLQTAVLEMLPSGLLHSHTNSVTWHSDITYENQPPGTTILYALDMSRKQEGIRSSSTRPLHIVASHPPSVSACKSLKALHSGHEQAEAALVRGSVVRRAPVTSTHPLIRTHPVTGEKAL